MATHSLGEFQNMRTQSPQRLDFVCTSRTLLPVRTAVRYNGASCKPTLRHSRTKSPKTKNDAGDNDCANQRPNKYFEPSAAFNQVAKKVASNAAERSTDYSRDLVTLLDPIWSSGRQGDHWKGY